MATPVQVTNGMTDASGGAFPAADVERELKPGLNTTVEVDPVSSKVAACVERKEQAEATEREKERQKKDALQTLKRTVIISGAIVAVAGALFAITKKLREK